MKPQITTALGQYDYIERELQRSCGMKPQITKPLFQQRTSLLMLQRSCGMKPQITRGTAGDVGNLPTGFKGAAA